MITVLTSYQIVCNGGDGEMRHNFEVVKGAAAPIANVEVVAKNFLMFIYVRYLEEERFKSIGFLFGLSFIEGVFCKWELNYKLNGHSILCIDSRVSNRFCS